MMNISMDDLAWQLLADMTEYAIGRAQMFLEGNPDAGQVAAHLAVMHSFLARATIITSARDGLQQAPEQEQAI